MLKRLLTVTGFLLLSACDDKPTFDDAQKNFYNNKSVFEELAKTTCQLGKKKQKFSYHKDSFSYSPDKIDEKDRILKIDKQLEQIKAYSINYKKTLAGKCSLVVGYYARGFGGSGISYNYSFQIDSVTPFEKDKHTFEKIDEAPGKVKFDMPLNSGWYFTFKSS